ncbi:metal-dependent phosphohydrolase [Mycolicibacterium mucogenicum]|uniref:HD domain-containing protein n=1 Tax=Mycolicibacterium mucogenicum TaxID=56689 RepID=UPI000AC6CB85|nr:metal-dependent phosphohydrolase [Mycolicibacterium mucogenicum]
MTVDNADDQIGELHRSWYELLAPHAGAAVDIAQTGRAVIASWAEPSRRYHDLDHLCDVLRSVDQLAAHAADPTAVRLAAWYHDVVYHGRSDDELASAARAERELFDLDVEHSLVTEVARLVRLTATHDPGPGDRNGETLCDADLRILASPADRYARYVAAVRAEYAHVPDAQFREGRAALLSSLLAGPALFRTPHGHAEWEAPARANLTAELRTLRA